MLKGDILIGGINVRDITTERLMSFVATVFQDVTLFNDTIFENIRWVRRTPPRGVIAAAKMAHCHEAIERLPDGYETVIGEGGATLSGGEKRQKARGWKIAKVEDAG